MLERGPSFILEISIHMQIVPENGPGILQKENIYTIIQDCKPKEYTISLDDISIMTFIKVKHNIQHWKGKCGLHMA
jgi:hypothetical protein